MTTVRNPVQNQSRKENYHSDKGAFVICVFHARGHFFHTCTQSKACSKCKGRHSELICDTFFSPPQQKRRTQMLGALRNKNLRVSRKLFHALIHLKTRSCWKPVERYYLFCLSWSNSSAILSFRPISAAIYLLIQWNPRRLPVKAVQRKQNQ
ncbi:hypothetical protein TNCT_559901 [Trichonephila clavata]|uniref:Uncharacterized protein n=1 Tax=Trichonephila clavata TaxID=2740835 RepID=A0A8X6G5J8_TRICU|nr:hypothetical protein TNCT_559901 [Trichonephila clavata]